MTDEAAIPEEYWVAQPPKLDRLSLPGCLEAGEGDARCDPQQSADDNLGEDQVMAFTETQTKALSAELSAKHVRTREKEGRTLSHVERWWAFAGAVSPVSVGYFSL